MTGIALSMTYTHTRVRYFCSLALFSQPQGWRRREKNFFFRLAWSRKKHTREKGKRWWQKDNFFEAQSYLSRETKQASRSAQSPKSIRSGHYRPTFRLLFPRPYPRSGRERVCFSIEEKEQSVSIRALHSFQPVANFEKKIKKSFPLFISSPFSLSFFSEMIYSDFLLTKCQLRVKVMRAQFSLFLPANIEFPEAWVRKCRTFRPWASPRRPRKTTSSMEINPATVRCSDWSRRRVISRSDRFRPSNGLRPSVGRFLLLLSLAFVSFIRSSSGRQKAESRFISTIATPALYVDAAAYVSTLYIYGENDHLTPWKLWPALSFLFLGLFSPLVRTPSWGHSLILGLSVRGWLLLLARSLRKSGTSRGSEWKGTKRQRTSSP